MKVNQNILPKNTDAQELIKRRVNEFVLFLVAYFVPELLLFTIYLQLKD